MSRLHAPRAATRWVGPLVLVLALVALPAAPPAHADGTGPAYTNVPVDAWTFDLWETLFGDWIDWTGYTPWDFQNCFDDWTAVMSGSTKPLPAFNCDEIHLQGESLICVQTNGFPGDLQRTADLRRLSLHLLQGAVLSPGTGLHTLFTNGTLVAVEIDWWSPANGFVGPTLAQIQGEVTALHGTNHNGDAVLLAYVVGYDAAGWASRHADIEGMIGHPMREFPQWTNASLAHCKDRGRLILVGSGSDFHGDIESNHDIRVQGHNNTAHHAVRVVGTITVNGSGNQADEIRHETALPLPPTPFTEAWARTAAQTQGAYHSGTLTVTAAGDLPISGVVFAEGDIDIQCDDLVGTWTLVSANGVIHWDGDDCQVDAAAGGVVAISFGNDVIVDGSGHTFRGGCWAPDDDVALVGSSNTIHGGIVAQRVLHWGHGNWLSNGLDPNAGN